MDNKGRNIFVPLISTTAFYLALHLCSYKVLAAVKMQPDLFLDFTLQVIIGYILFSFSRRTYLFLIVQFTQMALVYIGNAVKIAVFGAPIVIEDIFSFIEMCLVLKRWQAFLVIFPFALFLVLFFVNFKIHKKASAASLLVVVVTALVIIFGGRLELVNTIESSFGYKAWDQYYNFKKSGGTVYSLYRCLRFISDRPRAPGLDDVTLALKELNIENAREGAGDATRADKFVPRNIYMIVMEALWDPLKLEKVTFNHDPWDNEFRELWNETGNSSVMSPVYGGQTANPEFEILTGHPANLYGARVMFASGILNHIPALPRLLSRYGYKSYAFHPNISSFWNRHNIYYRFGFDFYFSRDHFTFDDLNGACLSDKSLYRQAMSLASKRLSENPNFLYILTITGHVDYKLNESKRPPIIKSDSSNKYVDRYSNVARYSTGEAIGLIRLIQKHDSNAIIVVAGDHLPLFGLHFAAYTESGILEDSIDKFTAKMYHTYASIPLIIIDGKNGPIDVGNIAMYEVPGIILKLLNLPDIDAIDMFKPPEKLHVRVFPGVSLVLDDENGSMQLCETGVENKTCKRVSEWLKNIRIIDKDILYGRQFSLKNGK
jgi:phosphoglycerol transferase MdoB-like AlkP superfamily enzyme